MKWIVFVFIMAPVLSHANDELLLGSLTQHFFNPSGIDSQFSNRMSEDGSLIRNPLVGYRHVETHGLEYDTVSYFGGQNSVGQLMFGAAWSMGLDQGGYRLGVIGGVYMQDSRPFLERGIMPVMMVPYNGWGPTPVLGLEATKTWKINNTTYFLVNGLLTVPFVNVSLGIGWYI